jgi:Tfp pilus assembly protein PilN
MKTIHLNLAAKPYRDYRPVYLTVAAMILATVVLLGYNVITGYEYLIETEQTREEITALDKEAANERERSAQLATQIEEIDLRALDRRSRFINTQINERAFSFSALLDNLEKTLPDDVKLLDLNPSIDDKGEIRLSMSCVAREKGGMLDLLDRFYADDRFQKAFPRSERLDADGTYRFSIDVEYAPEDEEEAAE